MSGKTMKVFIDESANKIVQLMKNGENYVAKIEIKNTIAKLNQALDNEEITNDRFGSLYQTLAIKVMRCFIGESE